MKKKCWLSLGSLAFFLFRAPLVLAVVPTPDPEVATLMDAEGMVGRILGAALPLLGLAVGIMIIVGGFQLLTSGGSKEGAQKAKSTFTYAIGGLILAILAWFILELVEGFTGVNVTKFAIPN